MDYFFQYTDVKIEKAVSGKDSPKVVMVCVPCSTGDGLSSLRKPIGQCFPISTDNPFWK